jgi:phosphoglycolate phosphatase-like HAD superfamily hydrolase
VIGDTPKDISCARAIGARAVVVATGQVTRQELAECAPDVLLDSFENHEAALRAIFP